MIFINPKFGTAGAMRNKGIPAVNKIATLKKANSMETLVV